MTAWYSKDINPSGKRSLVFTPDKALQRDAEIEIPCGQCIGCRLERSRQWAIRCVHEASLYEDNCFITLTFSPEYLQKRENPWSLDKKDFQKFMKRLRKEYGSGIRYFHCGEYGDTYLRPHYHACLFNFDFHDKQLWKISNDCRLYISDSLARLWPYGFSTIGDVTFDSAAYVARYIMKKITGDEAEEHYTRMDGDTGEFIEVLPEYTTMSLKPGIGTGWFEKYRTDVYPDDFVVINGKKMQPPKYYDRLLEKQLPYEHDYIKDQRKIRALNNSDENTRDRLDVKEKVKRRQIENGRLPRNLDKEN